MKTFEEIKEQFNQDIEEIGSFDELKQLEQNYFGRKNGKFTQLMNKIEDLPNEKKAEFGKKGNEAKNFLREQLESKKEELEQERLKNLAKKEKIDVTRPSLQQERDGHLHPITLTTKKLNGVAKSMGFMVEDGPELESKYFNFEALNIPKTHPAREAQDTFYLEDNDSLCMRSHVSNMQARLIDKYDPPFRAAYPGRCFRNEAVDASHEHTFDQFEALVVDTDINIGHCIGVIKELLNGLYEQEVEVRVRPGYFPFTEPSFEMDMSCILCEGEGCSVCEHIGWVEMLGAGLVHQNVIDKAGYDSDKWSGLAFGMGLTRLAMMKYGIEDIRHFNSGDLRFLNQF
ncbi:MAG: phenylalanine--tRNA ligase subunit alpha [Parcubacteria group bacterium QH_9_35_7]|nr:MAG: phenylalanine--tRNA ligase subunit alpha [Parcubacteria group bacterium QH_9_35_7]